MASGLMSGKRGLIMGVANDKSIAWGIAQACHEEGAELAFTYQGEALGKRVQPLAASVGSDIVLPCDVTDEASIDAVFATLAERWGTLDFLVHAIGFSDKNELRGSYTEMTTAANFTQTMLISVYSFTAAAQRAQRMMPNGGSLLTLTYYGAEKVMPHYNVMGVAKAALEASVKYMAMDLGPRGIRVNALSAGPDQDAGRERHRRLPLHHEVERAERAAAPQRHPGRRRQVRALPALGPLVGRHRRDPSRRRRLPRRRHEGRGRARHRRGVRAARSRSEPRRRRSVLVALISTGLVPGSGR